MSKKTIAIDDLADVIAKELATYKQEVTDDMKNEIKKAGNECKKEIQAESPVLTNSYKKGWRSSVVFENQEDIRVSVYNKTDYQLTHLLEYGHLNVATGGRVEGKAHISPARDNAAKKLNERIKVILR